MDEPRIKISRLTPEVRDNLVAYLDGELDEAGVREIDEVLAKNVVAQREIDSLVRSWELLDLLPMPTASADFTDKTVSMIRVKSAGVAPLSERAWFPKLSAILISIGVWAGWAAVAVVGFLLAARWIPSPSDAIVQDLPVLKNLPVYSDVGSIEFADELRRSSLFSEGNDASLSGQ